MSIRAALRKSDIPSKGFFTLGLHWGSFAALAPVLKVQVQADDATFGLLLLGTAVGLGSTIWLAPAFEKQMRAWALPLASTMLALAFLLPGFATTPIALFLVMMLVGMCSGLVDVVVNARVAELEHLHDTPLMNANHGAFSVGYAFSAIATGTARELGLDPAEIFAATSIVALVFAPMTKGVFAEIVEEEGDERHLPWGLIFLAGAVVMVSFMAEAVVESWSAILIERELDGRAAQGALAPAILGATMAVGRFYGQALTERIPPYLMIELAGIVAIIGTLIAATAGSPLMAYLGFALLGLGVSVIGPLGIAAAGRLAPPQYRTRAIARVAVLGFLGFMVAPAIMGGVSALFGLRTGFIAVAIILCTLPAFTFVLKRMDRT